MKITGMSSNCDRISFTASMPDELSASWMSARMRSGRSWAASSTAVRLVGAMPVTRCPISVTMVSISIAMIASSSMIRIDPAMESAISRRAMAIRSAASSVSMSMIRPISGKSNPSIACRRSASRVFGVSEAMWSWARPERRVSGSPSGAPAVLHTRWKAWKRATLGAIAESRAVPSASSASSVAAA